MDQLRALRYRKLALQEPNKEKAQLLQLLADKRIVAFYAPLVDPSQPENQSPDQGERSGYD
jgi:hypothetical protein